MVDRRELSFEGVEDVMTEVDQLLAGHEVSGAWTLGQILYHLATPVRMIVESTAPTPPAPTGPEAERTFAVRRRRFFSTGRFPAGAEIPYEVMVPPPDAEERVWARSLGEALRRLVAFEGPWPSHPVLGPLGRDEWLEFHRIHCAHHLGFARPTRPD